MKVGVHQIGYVINGTLSLHFIFLIRAVFSSPLPPFWKIIFNFNTYTLNVYYINTLFYANCKRTRKQLCFKYWYIDKATKRTIFPSDKNSIYSNFFNEKVATPLLKSVTCYITRTRFFPIIQTHKHGMDSKLFSPIRSLNHLQWTVLHDILQERGYVANV